MNATGARGLAQALAPAVLQHLGALVSAPSGPLVTRVDKVEVGTVRFTSRDGAADAIASAVSARLADTGDD
jgi:hypothetical protein